ncbi:MAG: hypothetical protein MSA43_06010 [Prevotella sp.]|nr:hypothetical protein [Prevotella sp.]
MRNRLYLKVAAVIMAITALPVFSLTAQAQREVQVMELQKQPDGTEVYVPKTIEVPEKSAEEVAAAKRKAATVTAEEDDLQYYLNHIVKTRAGESAVVIDLSTFSATTRETTLEVNQGISIKFTNGTLKSGTGLPSGAPVISISNGSVVEFDATVVISRNLSTDGYAVELLDASLNTAARISESHSNCISATSLSSKLEVEGGTIGGIVYHGEDQLVISGGTLNYVEVWSEANIIVSGGTLRCLKVCSEAYVIASGEDTYIDYLIYTKNVYRLYLKSAVKYVYIHDWDGEISDGEVLATGYDGYQLTENDMQRITVHSGILQVYDKCLEGNSIVLRKKVKDLQSAINNAADNTETTIDLDNYGELTTGILIPAGKKIKMTGTKNVALASNFTGDYIFRTEGDAQLTINIPGFSGYSSTALPKYGLVAGGSASKIQVNQSGTNTLTLPNTLLCTENGGTIDCYANISTKGIYNATGGTMNIYSESGEVETFTDDGGTVNITGPVKFYSIFTSLGTATMLSENVTSLAKLVLGKQSSMTFTSKWVKPTSLNISFKDNDYVLDQTYITFEKSTTMLSGFETVRFTLQSEHSAYLSGRHLIIEEVDEDALRQLEKHYHSLEADLASSAENVYVMSELIHNYYLQGLLTEQEYNSFCESLKEVSQQISDVDKALQIYEGLRPVFYGKYSVMECEKYAYDLERNLSGINERIANLENEIYSIIASRKKTFTNTDDLQDYLNSLAQNNETTPEDPAKVPVADGTEIKDIVIPEGTHVEIDIDGNGGESTDDLQAYLNGLVNVSEGSSLTIKGKWVVPTGALNPRIDVHGVINIYATIILEGTREEVVRVYGGGTANWRGNMPTGKIHNEGTLNHYSGTTGHIENHGTANHSGGTCHHIVNYKTYTFSGGTIDGNGSTFDYAFENHGTAHLTGGTIIHRHTLIYIVKGATTYIDGTKLDDRNATTTIRAYEDFHMRGDYKPVNIELYYGVRIHFLTSWTVRWHITFIDNRVTVRKVIFMSDDFTFDDRNIQYIDYPLPDGYRWYWNREENGIELRDDRVYDSDDLQNFLDGLASNPGTSLEPRRLYGDGHTVYINRRFSFPALTHVLIRDIRLIFDGADGRWDIPSGTTVYLCDTKVENDGEGVSGLHVHGDLYLEKTIFLNVHLYLYRTLYIWDRITSPLYIHYIADGGLDGGERIAEGADGYILTESDLQNLIYSDEPTDGHDWYLMLDGNAIVLADRNITGIGGIHGGDTATPRAAFTPDGTLRISGTSSDTPCMLFRTDGTRIATGTAAEIATKAMGIAKGHYILRIGSETLKLVR